MPALAVSPPAKLPPAMEGLVEDAPAKVVVNASSLPRTYADLDDASASVLRAQPSVLHCGGFTVGASHALTLRVFNTAPYSQRLRLLQPSLPQLKGAAKSSGSPVPPGGCLEVQLDFQPDELRYHYDTLRVQCEEGQVLVPFHAYPTLNTAQLPRRLDFGRCALGERAARTLRLACELPIDFDFEVAVVTPNACFAVAPLAGVVPARGSVEIAVEFCPARLATEALELEVRVVEFNAKPVRCTVSGSGFPGVAKGRQLKELTGSANPTIEQLELAGPPTFISPKRHVPKSPAGTRTRDGKGGAGGGDAFTRTQTSTARKSTGPLQPRTQPPPAETVVDGVRVPARLLGHTSTAAVLNQQPGRLNMRDVKAAIEEKKAALRDTQSSLRTTMAHSLAAGLDPLDDRSLPLGVKAALFEMQAEAAQQDAHFRESASASAPGEDVPSAEAVAAAARERERHATAHEQACQLADSRRLQTDLCETGAEHVVGSSGAPDGSAPPAPTWDLNAKDTWIKRQQVLQRFVQAGRRVLLQRRVARRLAALRALLDGLGRDKARVAAEVLRALSDRAPAQGRPALDPSRHFKLDNISEFDLPIYSEADFQKYEPVEVPPLDALADFECYQPHALPEQAEWRKMGYEPEAFPAYTAYTPPCAELPLLSGAPEELLYPEAPILATGPAAAVSHLHAPATGAAGAGMRQAGAGAAADCDVDEPLLAMPEALVHPPVPPLVIGSMYDNSARVKVALGPAWGMDDDARVQPRVLPLPHDCLRDELPATNSVRALAGAAHLATVWLPTTQDWQAQTGGRLPVPPLMKGPNPDDAAQLRSSPAVAAAGGTPGAPRRHGLPDDELARRMLARGAAATQGGGGGSGGPGQRAVPDVGWDQMPKWRAERQLEAQAAAQRRARVEELDKQAAEFNSRLKSVHKHGVKL